MDLDGPLNENTIKILEAIITENLGKFSNDRRRVKKRHYYYRRISDMLEHS